MHKIAQVYYKRCQEYGLDPILVPEISGFLIKFGQQQVVFQGGNISLNNSIAANISSNKYTANRLLSKEGLPVPKAKAYTREAYHDGKMIVSDLTFPVVIKPTWDSMYGRGVICNIPNATELDTLMFKSYELYPCMSIEEYYGDLRSFRVLIFNGEVIALMERVPAHVIGDGKSTIHELIENENKKREIPNLKMPFGKIIMTEETDLIFRERKISSTDIPQAKQKIPIRLTCNAAVGGTVVGLDRTAICKENAALAIRAAEVLNLQLVGLDFLCEDLEIPIEKSRGCIIEANHSPDITAHEYSPEGVPSFPSKHIIKYLIRRYRWSH
jgi:D-alanine-D-alanine ligase-like ATP-grasp enzyme